MNSVSPPNQITAVNNQMRMFDPRATDANVSPEFVHDIAVGVVNVIASRVAIRRSLFSSRRQTGRLRDERQTDPERGKRERDREDSGAPESHDSRRQQKDTERQ